MKIYIDFDSTLVDSVSAWIKWINKNNSIPYPGIQMKDVKTYSWLQLRCGQGAFNWWKDKDTYSKDIIKPFDRAVDFVESLKDMYGKNNIYIATYSFEEIIKVKNILIEELFDIKQQNIIHSKKKWLHTYDGILIDDNINNCLIHKAVNDMPSILFNYKNVHPWSDQEIMNTLDPYILFSRSYESLAFFIGNIYGRN